MTASIEEKLQRRKLEALKRGVHRMSGAPALPTSTHVVGIGRAGSAAVSAMLRTIEPDAPKFTALVVDIGEQDMTETRELAAAARPRSADVTFLALGVPSHEELSATLTRYPECLAIEYPRYAWGAGYEPWLGDSSPLPTAGGHFPRAVAKAIYGAAFYDRDRPMERALRTFANGVEASRSQAAIAVVFGLGGGTGSGVAVDLVRHLSSCMFGRAALVAGVAIAPCDGDAPVHRGAQVYAALNELDCLCDETKNRGVVKSCGDLFANPFTAGLIVLPQQQVWLGAKNLAQTQQRASEEVANFVTGNSGVNLWETLRLLNWVAAPSTQHSAARTPWGAKWVHVLGFADAKPGAISADLKSRMGLRSSYRPEFIEMRAAVSGTDAAVSASALAEVFSPDVPLQVTEGARDGSVQFILPRATKTDLAIFVAARDAYDREAMPERLLAHSMLLDQGVLLSEPSTRLDGMAGASLSASRSWVAVPFGAVRGELENADAA